MPELPDVEGFRRVLAEHAAGVPIRKVDVLDRQVLHDTNAAALREALSGNRFAEPRRHGKWLIAGIDGDRRTVLIHFGMTGELVWTERDASAHRYDRVVFGFDSGDLRYRDMRKLKGLWLEPQSGVGEELSGLGPDACRVSREELAALLSRSRGGIKATLTDQAVVAGLGNLLGDEILWRARINPRERADRLGRGDVTRLHTAMVSVLRQGIRVGRVPPRPSWLTGHRDEPSGHCPRCGTVLGHARIGGRATVWCPHCQPV